MSKNQNFKHKPKFQTQTIAPLGRDQRLKIIFLQRFRFVAGLLIIPTISLGFALFLAFKVNFEKKNDALGKNIKDSSIISSSTLDNQLRSSKSSFLIEPAEELPKEVDLKIQLIKSELNLGSSFASLQMALKKYEINVSQKELSEQITKAEPLEKKFLGDKIIWGNPNKGFVGDVNGSLVGVKKSQKSQRFGTGWGVNNGPITELAQKFRPSSQEVDSADLFQIKKALSQNFPVLIWYVREDALQEDLEITTPDEKKIIFSQTQVAVLDGYFLDQNGETNYKIVDPDFGEFNLSETDFLKQWGKTFNDIVIVQ
jgi:uncharacterized protein YvpB